MKSISIMLGSIVIFFGCSKDDALPLTTTPGSEPITFPVAGEFVSAPNESVEGSAKIVDENGVKSLIFDDAFRANGPDLKVYLSIDATASDYKSLGSVQSPTGMQAYSIDSTIDLNKYGKYVVIYCQQYSVRFGTAELE